MNVIISVCISVYSLAQTVIPKLHACEKLLGQDVVQSCLLYMF